MYRIFFIFFYINFIFIIKKKKYCLSKYFPQLTFYFSGCNLNVEENLDIQ